MNTFTRWPSVDRSPTPTGWARPGNLMPAVGPSSWPRGRRATSEAEEILATAEAWWDVDRSGFRDGDRFLRNIGTAGSVLDLRLGSSGVANSNDPKWLGPEDTGYVYVPGIGTNYLSVPDENALDITGDIDIRLLVALDSWTPAATNDFMAKWIAAQQSYYFQILATGRLRLNWTTNGSATISKDSTASVPGLPGQALWVRVTLTVNNGAAQNEVRFYTSVDGSTWAQLGTTVTTAGTTSIFAGTSPLSIGAYNTGSGPITGKLYRAQVLNGINGTTVLDVDCDAITSGAATTFAASTGQTVSINRATSGRKSVAMPSKVKGGRPCMLLGTDDYLECLDAAQHGLLNFGGADSFTVLAVARKFGSSTGVIICKQQTLLITKGWSINHEASVTLYGIHDGIALNTLSRANTLGAQNVVIATRLDKSLRFSIDSTGNSGTQTNTGDARNIQTVRVGNQGGDGNFGNMEFRAAAIFRRALTAREITVLTNAAPWGV